MVVFCTLYDMEFSRVLYVSVSVIAVWCVCQGSAGTRAWLTSVTVNGTAERLHCTSARLEVLQG